MQVVGEPVGQREIGDRPFVDSFVEIAVAAVEGDVAVVVIEHRRDAVEAEPVETVLFEPVFDVRQQEMFDLRFSVVEEFRVPVRLVTGGACGRVEVVGAVQFVDSFVEVADIVRVDEIHDDGQAQLVCAANQSFQFFGRSEARRRCEKVRYVVAERTVVGVLGYGHQLHGVVAVARNDGQNPVGEFAVGAHAGPFLRHAHVGFVDEQFVMAGDVERVVRPVEGTRNPELRREVLRPLVLHYARGVGRNPVEPAVAAVDVDLVERSVPEPVAVHGLGQEDAPHPLSVFVQTQFGALPAVEVAEQVDVAGAGQPFAEPPPFERGVVLPAEIPVAVGVVDE